MRAGGVRSSSSASWSAMDLVPGYGDGVAMVVGMPGLGLEREKNRGEAIAAWLVEDETAVGPDPVVVPMLIAIALVHMDVVDAVAGCEAEDVVWCVNLRPPARAIGVESASRSRFEALDVKIELVDEIVARTRPVCRYPPHMAAVEHAAALEIQGKPAGLESTPRSRRRRPPAAA